MKRLLWLPLVSLFWFGCGGEQAPSTLTPSETETPIPQETQERIERTQKIFYSIPSPVEMATVLKRIGATYEYDLPNDVKRAEDYQGAAQQALNLGVYGADLSYASIFNESGESMLFMSAARRPRRSARHCRRHR